MTRDELRAFDPQFAALADMARANGCDIRVSHYAAHDGWELGKPDAEPANEFVISAESYDALRAHAAYQAQRRNRR